MDEQRLAPQVIAMEKIVHYAHDYVGVIPHPRRDNKKRAEQGNTNSNGGAKICFQNSDMFIIVCLPAMAVP